MIDKRLFNVNSLLCLGLDKADEMLSWGFKDQCYDSLRTLPPSVQVCLLDIPLHLWLELSRELLFSYSRHSSGVSTVRLRAVSWLCWSPLTTVALVLSCLILVTSVSTRVSVLILIKSRWGVFARFQRSKLGHFQDASTECASLPARHDWQMSLQCKLASAFCAR